MIDTNLWVVCFLFRRPGLQMEESYYVAASTMREARRLGAIRLAADGHPKAGIFYSTVDKVGQVIIEVQS